MSRIPQSLKDELASAAPPAPGVRRQLLVRHAEYALARLRDHEARHGLDHAVVIDPADAIGAAEHDEIAWATKYDAASHLWITVANPSRPVLDGLVFEGPDAEDRAAQYAARLNQPTVRAGVPESFYLPSGASGRTMPLYGADEFAGAVLMDPGEVERLAERVMAEGDIEETETITRSVRLAGGAAVEPVPPGGFPVPHIGGKDAS